MYALYNRIHENNNQLRLTFKNTLSLAGCNRGIIVNELRKILKPWDNAKIGWSIPIAEKWNKNNYSVIIDIKPKGKEVFLCELDRVFGYSYYEWSPVMLKLKILVNTYSLSDINKKDFLLPKIKPEIVYTVYYLKGSIKDGKIIGTWNPPFGSITALLFWSEAMTFFYQQIKKHNAEFLNSDINLISSLKIKARTHNKAYKSLGSK